MENGEVRVAWDMTIYTDKVLKHNRPDITRVHKDTQKWTLIDIAVPADQNIIRTEDSWSLESHHDTYRDWCSWKHIEKTWADKLGVPEFIASVQVSAILGTAHLLRKVSCL